MKNKTCSTCKKEKSIADFYYFPSRGDYSRSCKVCDREKVSRRYYQNRVCRLAEIRKYQKTKRGKAVNIKTQKDMYAKYPLKFSARHRFNYALKTGKVTRKPCQVCGQVAEAHHPDYSKPYEVIWLCRLHHLAYEEN